MAERIDCVIAKNRDGLALDVIERRVEGVGNEKLMLDDVLYACRYPIVTVGETID